MSDDVARSLAELALRRGGGVGPPGPAGPAGPAGATGATGATGPVGPAGPATITSPTEIAGLVAGFDSIAGKTLSGTDLTQWDDTLAGSGLSLVLVNASKPQNNANGWATGVASIDFSGSAISGTVLKTSVPVALGHFTFVFICDASADTGNGEAIVQGADTGAPDTAFFWNGASSDISVNRGGVLSSKSDTSGAMWMKTPLGDHHVFIWRFGGTHTLHTMLADEQPRPQTNVTANNPGDAVVTATIYVGGDQAGVFGISAKVRWVLIFNRWLTFIEAMQLEGWGATQ